MFIISVVTGDMKIMMFMALMLASLKSPLAFLNLLISFFSLTKLLTTLTLVTFS